MSRRFPSFEVLRIKDISTSSDDSEMDHNSSKSLEEIKFSVCCDLLLIRFRYPSFIINY